MRIKGKPKKFVLLIFSSLAPIFFAIVGMYLTFELTHTLGVALRSLVILVVGIFAFAAGVIFFWRITEIITPCEVKQ